MNSRRTFTSDVDSGAWTTTDLAHVGRAVDAVTRAGLLSQGSQVDVADLSTWLYTNWYAVRPGSGGPIVAADSPAPRPGVLTAAHAGSDAWEGGVVTRVGVAGVVVVRTADGHQRAVQRGDYASAFGSARVGLLPRVNDTLRIRKRAGCVTAEGWWQTWSSPRRASLEGQISRVYLTPAVDRLTDVVTATTRVLQRLSRTDGLHWTLKVGTHPGTLARPDAIVIYVADADVAATAGALADGLAEEGPSLLADQSPPFTCVVAPGVAWANDPGDGTSYGEALCHLVATILLGGRSSPGPTAREGAAGPGLSAVDFAGELRQAGVDPVAPHVRRRSTLAAAS